MHDHIVAHPLALSLKKVKGELIVCFMYRYTVSVFQKNQLFVTCIIGITNSAYMYNLYLLQVHNIKLFCPCISRAFVSQPDSLVCNTEKDKEKLHHRTAGI